MSKVKPTFDLRLSTDKKPITITGMTDPLPVESAEIKTEKAVRDSFVALCGRVFRSDPEFFPQAEFRGRTIYLCTDACLGAFLSDPDRFVAAHKKKYAAKGIGSTTEEVCLTE